MTIMDEKLEFADATAVGAPNGSTVNVGDVLDYMGAAQDIGTGHPMAVVVQVTTTITSGGAATVRFKVVSDSTDTIATNGDATEHGSTDAIAVASLTAGKQYVIPLSLTEPPYERFLAFQVEETASQALTAGAVNAFLVPLDHVRSYQAFPDAVN